MIEINLVPDVKQEFIRAQHIRNGVISAAIIVAIACFGALALLSVYVFGAQAWRDTKADENITAGIQKLQSVEDLDKALTVQNQLSSISSIQDDTELNSRLFDTIATVTPTGENAVVISKFSMDSESGTITIEGRSKYGYRALDAFKKTILATKFTYETEGSSDKKSVTLTDSITDGNRSFGEDDSGQRSLQFEFTFEYSSELFSRDSRNAEIVGPERTNATDSALEIPRSIFSTDDQEGAE